MTQSESTVGRVIHYWNEKLKADAYRGAGKFPVADQYIANLNPVSMIA